MFQRGFSAAIAAASARSASARVGSHSIVFRATVGHHGLTRLWSYHRTCVSLVTPT